MSRRTSEWEPADQMMPMLTSSNLEYIEFILFRTEDIIPNLGAMVAASWIIGSFLPALAHPLSPKAKSNVEKKSVPGIVSIGKKRERNPKTAMTGFGGSISAVQGQILATSGGARIHQPIPTYAVP